MVLATHGAKMAAERQDALREFVAVTGTEEDRARFFLESAGWDLQVVLRGGVRRPGRGLRGTGSWCQACSGRSAPSSRRAAARPRPQGPGPLAARRQVGLGVGRRGLAAARPAVPGQAFLFCLARQRSQRDFGHCRNPRGEGQPGGVAAAPRLG